VLIVRMEPSDYEGLIGHADPTPVGTACGYNFSPLPKPPHQTRVA